MQTISQTFAGAATWPLQMAGDYFRLISAPSPVDLVFYKNGSQIATANAMDTGFYFRPVGGFDRVDVVTATAQTIKLFIMSGDGGYDHFNVDISGGVAIQQASTINDLAAVSVGVAATQLVAASATRKGLRFTNAGAADVYIGGASVTVAGGAIKISAGQTWLESEGASAKWYGISGTAAQSVKIQELA